MVWHRQLIAAVVGLLVVQPAWFGDAYLETPTNSRVHGRIMMDSVDYLSSILPASQREDPSNNDGIDRTQMLPVLSILQNQLATLTKGQIDANYENGLLEVFDKTYGRNSLSHYYNPVTETGYKLPMSSPIEFLYRAGAVDHQLSQIMTGPAINSVSMADWYYSRALYHYQTNLTESVRCLSYAAHMLHDASVPQHSNDCGPEEDDCFHFQFEQFVEDNYDFLERPSSGYTTILDVARLYTAGQLVQELARVSQPLLVEAKSGDTVRMGAVANQMVPMTIEVNAALVVKYIRDVVRILRSQSEAGSELGDNAVQRAVVFQIQKVAVTGKLSGREVSKADVRPVVEVLPSQSSEQDGSSSNQGLKADTRGYFVDTDIVEPQRHLDGFGWTFVHVVTKADLDAGHVRFRLRLEEMNANFWCGKLCGTASKLLVLAPGMGTNGTNLEVTFELPDADASAESVFPIKTITSVGCNDERRVLDECADTVQVDYVVGESYQISGAQTDLTQASSNGVLTVKYPISMSGMVMAAGFGALLLMIFFCLCGMFCPARDRSCCCKGGDVQRTKSKKEKMQGFHPFNLEDDDDDDFWTPQRSQSETRRYHRRPSNRSQWTVETTASEERSLKNEAASRSFKNEAASKRRLRRTHEALDEEQGSSASDTDPDQVALCCK